MARRVARAGWMAERCPARQRSCTASVISHAASAQAARNHSQLVLCHKAHHARNITDDHISDNKLVTLLGFFAFIIGICHQAHADNGKHNNHFKKGDACLTAVSIRAVLTYHL